MKTETRFAPIICRSGKYLVFGLWNLVVLTSTSLAADSKGLVTEALAADLPYLQALYTHFHANPELSHLEEKTAGRVASELRAAGYEVTEKIGGHGVVGVLRNGEGPTVLIRTDLDALPVKEQTGLSYASSKTQKDITGEVVPVMHACGHDM